jgi:hypothetical protein
MKLLFDEVDSYRTSIGLLAIHSAISLTDAITVGFIGKKERYQDHARAAHTLASLCGSHRVSNRQGVELLRWLIAQKMRLRIKNADSTTTPFGSL